MRTDSIFFEIFQKMPQLFFEVLGESAEKGEQYKFCSVEVKQTAFRIDGVFQPKPEASDRTVIFAEVQFQKDEKLYSRMFSEIMMYLNQNPETEDWMAIAIYPRRGLEPKNQHLHRSLLVCDQVKVIYLEDLLGQQTQQIGIQLMQLIVSKAKDTSQYLKRLVQQLQGKTDPENQAIIGMIGTIMVYKFPELSREEIQAMFTVNDLKQTKVYQEALDEGRSEEAQSLVLRQLNRRVGAIAPETETQIRSLTLPKIEALGEALLDFRDRADLGEWLAENQ